MKKLSPEELQSITADYEGGVVARELEEKYGVKRSSIYSHFSNRGMARKPLGKGITKKHKQPKSDFSMTVSNIKLMLKLKKGLHVDDIEVAEQGISLSIN